ncbi:YitT family protein [Neobacillus dielmonensis]|uniref:YitT family protein n=1 Tax=Neobacillus dielmonensis TaxID=1347369 RepID=UPI0005A6F05C|nr:YitT family protein [Neobacillus dielmonensis]
MYRKRYLKYINNDRNSSRKFYRQASFIFIGAILVAISLQLLLVKNNLIDGGIIGICIMVSDVTGMDIGVLLFLLNTPFFLIGYKMLGKRFFAMSFYANLVLMLTTSILEPVPVITGNPLLIIVLGGVCLGLGVGTIIRFGGCLDGTEVLSILFSERTSLSIGQYVFLFNFLIFASSIFIFGLHEAIYSMAVFFVAYQTIDASIRIH